MTNTELLNQEIKNSGLKKSWIANQLELSTFGFQKKVNNETQFKAGEIQKLCELLNITSLRHKDEIFFNLNVDKMTTVKGGN